MATWARAAGSRSWTFPEDHGAHSSYRTEWWYFTGNLKDSAGNRYGYQLTFFRQGLRLQPGSPENPWSVRDVYLGHFAVSDISKSLFQAEDRISRAGPGLAHAKIGYLHVWVLNWSAQKKGATFFLEAEEQNMALRLQLRPRKPLVLHGQNGLSTKGPMDGQASYYYSYTDLETSGFIKTGSEEPWREVEGTSWFDHEFGSSQLSSDQEGWDWFSLHLSDGKDLMIYLIRRKDGSIEPASSGTLAGFGGSCRHLPLADISVSVLERWQSPISGAIYPVRWRIQIPSAELDLWIGALMVDQELDTSDSTGVIYWEGAVTGEGLSDGKAVACEGYAELTGYAGSLGGVF